MSQNQKMMRLAQAALQNDNAGARIVAEGLPLIRGRYEELMEEIEYRHNNEWDADEARELAMKGRIPPGQVQGAFSDLQRSIIRILALTPAALLVEGPKEASVVGEMWNEALLGLLVKLHNPTIKYGIIGGFEKENREVAEEYVERFATEIWGTIDILTRDDAVGVEDFPPETAAVIEQVAQAVEGQGAD